jgi:SAM-dependent methyltransferase
LLCRQPKLNRRPIRYSRGGHILIAIDDGCQSRESSIDLDTLQQTWNQFGLQCPMWAILSEPDKREKGWECAEFFANGEAQVAQTEEYLARLGMMPQRGRALDFGCGIGRLTQALARRYERVDGVDIAPSMIAQAQVYNRHGARCRYHVNCANDLALFTDESFDLVYSWITLQHMPPRLVAAYLAEFWRVLAPGGVLLFHITSAASWLLRVCQAAKCLVPDTLLAVYRRLLYGPRYQDWPVAEMYATPRTQIVRQLTARGAIVVDVRPDPFYFTDSPAMELQSYVYVAVKPGTAA